MYPYTLFDMDMHCAFLHVYPSFICIQYVGCRQHPKTCAKAEIVAAPRIHLRAGARNWEAVDLWAPWMCNLWDGICNRFLRWIKKSHPEDLLRCFTVSPTIKEISSFKKDKETFLGYIFCIYIYMCLEMIMSLASGSSAKVVWPKGSPGFHGSKHKSSQSKLRDLGKSW